MSLDNYNYWNDSRTIAGMVSKVKIEETKQGNFIIWEEDEDITHRLRCKWEVCETCNGNGRHVNAGIDCNGLTAEDFYEDPEFEAEYFSGTFDVTCNECNGRRVVPVLDELANDKDLVARYQKYRDDEYNDARASAQERAMGA
jgi:hypothetical protein